MSATPEFRHRFEHEASVRVRGPNDRGHIERGTTRGLIYGFAIGVGFGAFLLAVISALASPY